MLRPVDDASVYLYRDHVDMRKFIDGLLLLVEQAMDLSPFGPVLFLFCNRQRDKFKLLYWEPNGFMLWFTVVDFDTLSGEQPWSFDPIPDSNDHPMAKDWPRVEDKTPRTLLAMPMPERLCRWIMNGIWCYSYQQPFTGFIWRHAS